MTSRLFLFLAASTMVVGSAGWAVAASLHSMDMRLTSAILVNGTTIPAGRYNLSWNGDDNQGVNVTIEQRGHVVANAPAKVEELDKAAREDEVITRMSKSGPATLEEVRQRGRKTTLVFPAS